MSHNCVTLVYTVVMQYMCPIPGRDLELIAKMPDLQLTPAGHLRWLESADTADEGRTHAELCAAFARDWREGLFLLAAQRVWGAWRSRAAYIEGAAR